MTSWQQAILLTCANGLLTEFCAQWLVEILLYSWDREWYTPMCYLRDTGADTGRCSAQLGLIKIPGCAERIVGIQRELIQTHYRPVIALLIRGG